MHVCVSVYACLCLCLCVRVFVPVPLPSTTTEKQNRSSGVQMPRRLTDEKRDRPWSETDRKTDRGERQAVE